MKYCKTTKNGELIGIFKGAAGYPKKNSTTITEHEFNMIHLYCVGLKNEEEIPIVLKQPTEYMYNP